MPEAVPYCRQAGTAGPGVVCLHANASSSTQWRALLDLLAPQHRVFAPDAYGAGKSPGWAGSRLPTLADEVALLEPVFAAAAAPFFLVGHSYGAAVALKAALARPERVRAIAVYEPTLFGLLEEEQPSHPAAQGIAAAAAAAAAAIDAQDPAAAAEHFIDYWMGPGTWRGTPAARQAPIAASMAGVRGWSAALFHEPTPLQAFRGLACPVLYLVGAQAPAASRGVARLLTAALPAVEVIEFAELGHMGPVTHPQVVNEAIVAFLARH